MGKGSRSGAALRRSVTITPRVLPATKQPERRGLPQHASADRVFSRLIEIGWEHVLERDRERAELEAYDDWAQDREGLEVVRALQRDGL